LGYLAGAITLVVPICSELGMTTQHIELKAAWVEAAFFIDLARRPSRTGSGRFYYDTLLHCLPSSSDNRASLMVASIEKTANKPAEILRARPEARRLWSMASISDLNWPMRDVPTTGRAKGTSGGSNATA
jgi:hypothetical protein